MFAVKFVSANHRSLVGLNRERVRLPVGGIDGERICVTAAAGDVIGFNSEGLWDDDCVRFSVALCLIFLGRSIEVVMLRSINFLICVFMFSNKYFSLS